MEVRQTVRRFPGVAFALIVGLAAALVVAMVLSVGGWGLAIPGTSAQPAGQTPITSGPACSWQDAGACSTSP